MNLLKTFTELALIGLLCVGISTNSTAQGVKLLHVSYDPTRELFKEYNEVFIRNFEKEFGKIEIMQSHGGSGKQARAVIDGLRAHIVSLALEYDVMIIAKHGFIKTNWYGGNSTKPSPFYSTIVFLVRKGNPKGIKDWDDLVKPGIAVITPNPKTSGGARWNFLAAWGYMTVYKKTSESAAESFIKRLYNNVPVLDTGARGATTTFVQRGIGDVYICWENEAMLAIKEYSTNQIEIVYPSVSILAEPCLAVVDKNVDRNGPLTRKAAENYVEYLYSTDSQELIAKHHYRPYNSKVMQKYASKFPAIKLFTVKEVAENWEKAHEKFFSENGVFEKIHRP
ncbi:MAG: sulfate ABC transporter substrate-binding protein [Verrucomicrobiae bacterium]|nr:sulfate ABC transporter substrate-binding protein [Verrucomicrobiae bacterium]